MHPDVKKELDVRFKQTVVEIAKVSKFASSVLREYDVSRSSFHHWKRQYEEKGKALGEKW